MMRRPRPRRSDTSRTLHIRGTRRYFLTLEEPPVKHWELIPTEGGEDGSPGGPAPRLQVRRAALHKPHLVSLLEQKSRQFSMFLVF